MNGADAPHVLVIAGSDRLAYSGLEADLRHLDAFGIAGWGVTTARTVQSLDGFVSMDAVDAGTLDTELEAAFETCPDAVKIGMLFGADVVDRVADRIALARPSVVLDPVLASSSGQPLIDDAGRSVLLSRLVPLARLVTPNLEELSLLVPDIEDPADAARALCDRGAQAVLVKGGHAEPASTVEDVLVMADDIVRWSGPRLPGVVPRGTGCALATVVAAGLARGAELVDAVEAARAAVARGIEAAMSRGTRLLVLEAT